MRQLISVAPWLPYCLSGTANLLVLAQDNTLGMQADTPWGLEEEQALRIYRAMVGLQTMDVVFYDSQRQASALNSV